MKVFFCLFLNLRFKSYIFMWSRNTPLNIPSIRIKNSKNLYKNPNGIHTRYWQAIWGNLNFVFWDGLVCSPGWPPMLGLPGSASRMQASEMYVTPPRRSRSWGFFVFPPNNGSHYDIFFMHVSSSALPKRPPCYIKLEFEHCSYYVVI